ncbi:YciC family protein [Buchnera aphidicola (Ceratoglyphina bambusae)]|uniref:YciC family protein n=1 Tax=Buchnera aphidicola TaxID=9 RepID=UPI0031B84012
MLIKETNSYQETFNFVKKNLTKIFLISCFFSFLVVISDYYVIPVIQKIYFSVLSKDIGMHSLINTFNSMNFSQQKAFLQFSFLKNVVNTVSITFIIESILMIAHFKILKKKIGLKKLYKLFFSIFPNLFLLIFFINIIIQVGLIIFVIPAIAFLIFFSMSPIILVIEKKGVFYSIKKSFLVCLSRYKELTPPIFIWLFIKFILLMCSSILKILPENLFIFSYNIISNFILCVLIVHLFKLYSLFANIKKF